MDRQSLVKVLVYVDGPEHESQVLRAVNLIAQHFPAEITLLTTDDRTHSGSTRLEHVRSSLIMTEDDQAATVVQTGAVEEVILSQSMTTPYDLIVVTAADRSRLMRLFLGSRVGHVVRESNTSVLVVRRPPESIQRILVSIGGMAQSLETVHLAGQWGLAFDAPVTILHVLSQLPLMFQGLEAEPGHHTLDNLVSIEPEVRPLLQQAIDDLTAGGVFGSLRLREGLVAEQVLAEVVDGGYDLLVIGAHAASGIDRLLMEDLCNRLVLKSPISTLVVR